MFFKKKHSNRGYLEGLTFAQESSLGHDYLNREFMQRTHSKEELDNFAAGMRDFHYHQKRLEEWGTTSIEVTPEPRYDTREEPESVDA